MSLGAINQRYSEQKRVVNGKVLEGKVEITIAHFMDRNLQNVTYLSEGLAVGRSYLPEMVFAMSIMLSLFMHLKLYKDH